MKKWLLIAFLAGLIVMLVLFTRGNPSFHRDFPTRTTHLLVVDESGQPIPEVLAQVTTTYWYPTLIGSKNSKQFIDTYRGEKEGNVQVVVRQHPQITRTRLQITASGHRPFETNINDELPWFDEIHPNRRIALLHSRRSTPDPTVRWGSGYLSKTLEIEWSEAPIGLSLSTGELTAGEGDILFEIERPPFDHPNKLDQPVRMRIEYPRGKFELVTRNEVAFELAGGVSKWGRLKRMERARPNSRHHPAFVLSLAFSSDDGRTRGAITISCSPVGEGKENAAIVNFSVYGKVWSYEPSISEVTSLSRE